MGAASPADSTLTLAAMISLCHFVLGKITKIKKTLGEPPRGGGWGGGGGVHTSKKSLTGYVRIRRRGIPCINRMNAGNFYPGRTYRFSMAYFGNRDVLQEFKLMRKYTGKSLS